MYDDATATITWTYAALLHRNGQGAQLPGDPAAPPADLAPGTYGWEGTNVAEFGSDTVGVQPTNDVHTVAVETQVFRRPRTPAPTVRTPRAPQQASSPCWAL